MSDDLLEDIAENTKNTVKVAGLGWSKVVSVQPDENQKENEQSSIKSVTEQLIEINNANLTNVDDLLLKFEQQEKEKTDEFKTKFWENLIKQHGKQVNRLTQDQFENAFDKFYKLVKDNNKILDKKFDFKDILDTEEITSELGKHTDTFISFANNNKKFIDSSIKQIKGIDNTFAQFSNDNLDVFGNRIEKDEFNSILALFDKDEREKGILNFLVKSTNSGSNQAKNIGQMLDNIPNILSNVMIDATKVSLGGMISPIKSISSGIKKIFPKSSKESVESVSKEKSSKESVESVTKEKSSKEGVSKEKTNSITEKFKKIFDVVKPESESEPSWVSSLINKLSKLLEIKPEAEATVEDKLSGLGWTKSISEVTKDKTNSITEKFEKIFDVVKPESESESEPSWFSSLTDKFFTLLEIKPEAEATVEDKKSISEVTKDKTNSITEKFEKIFDVVKPESESEPSWFSSLTDKFSTLLEFGKGTNSLLTEAVGLDQMQFDLAAEHFRGQFDRDSEANKKDKIDARRAAAERRQLSEKEAEAREEETENRRSLFQRLLNSLDNLSLDFKGLDQKGPQGIFKKILTLAALFIGMFAGLIFEVGVQLGNGIKYITNIIRNKFLKNKWGTKLDDVITSVKKIFDPIVKGGKKLKKLGSKIRKFLPFFDDIFSAILKGFRMGRRFAKAIPLVGQIIYVLETAFFTILRSIQGGIKGFKEGGIIGGVIGLIKGGLKGLFEGAIGNLLDMIKGMITWVVKKLGFTNAAKWLSGWNFTELYNKFIDGVFGFFGLLKNIFLDLVGIGDGKGLAKLKEITNGLKERAAEVTKSILKNVVPHPSKASSFKEHPMEWMTGKIIPDSVYRFVWGHTPAEAEEQERVQALEQRQIFSKSATAKRKEAEDKLHTAESPEEVKKATDALTGKIIIEDSARRAQAISSKEGGRFGFGGERKKMFKAEDRFGTTIADTANVYAVATSQEDGSDPLLPILQTRGITLFKQLQDEVASKMAQGELKTASELDDFLVTRIQTINSDKSALTKLNIKSGAWDTTNEKASYLRKEDAKITEAESLMLLKIFTETRSTGPGESVVPEKVEPSVVGEDQTSLITPQDAPQDVIPMLPPIMYAGKEITSPDDISNPNPSIRRKEFENAKRKRDDAARREMGDEVFTATKAGISVEELRLIRNNINKTIPVLPPQKGPEANLPGVIVPPGTLKLAANTIGKNIDARPQMTIRDSGHGTGAGVITSSNNQVVNNNSSSSNLSTSSTQNTTNVYQGGNNGQPAAQPGGSESGTVRANFGGNNGHKRP